MNILIIPTLILLLILPIMIFAYREGKKHGTKLSEEFAGICNIAFDRTVKKKANLYKIIALFASAPELTNTEIRHRLGVSSRTAVRYMDELEQQEKVEQVGRIGHTVTYRLKQG